MAKSFPWPSTSIGMTYAEMYDALYTPEGLFKFDFRSNMARKEIASFSDIEWSGWIEYKRSREKR
jgi:hypothetical protein